MTPLFDSQLLEYCISHSKPLHPELENLSLQTQELFGQDSNMLIGPIEGSMLHLLVKLSKTKSILEIGTFTGYSAICMALALDNDGSLLSLDQNTRGFDLAKNYFKKTGVNKKINLSVGEAKLSLKKIIAAKTTTFDFIFIDADKENYPTYLDLCIPLLNKEGLIVVDNCLWSGTVLNPKEKSDKAIDQLNNTARHNLDFFNLLLPIRDGMMILQKKNSG